MATNTQLHPVNKKKTINTLKIDMRAMVRSPRPVPMKSLFNVPLR